jgi:hypothetical protein
MQQSNQSLWRQAATLVFGTSLALVLAGAVASQYGDPRFAFVFSGAGVCLALGFVTRATLKRRR